MGAERGVAALPDPLPTSGREQGWWPPATGGKKQGQVGAAWGTASFPQGLGLAACSCPRPHGGAPLLPAVVQPGAARVHPPGGANRHIPGIPTCNPSTAAVCRHPGKEGWGVCSSSPPPPGPHSTPVGMERAAPPWAPRVRAVPAASTQSCPEPAQALPQGCSRQRWGAKAASGSVCVPQQGAPLVTPSPSTGVPPSPGVLTGSAPCSSPSSQRGTPSCRSGP